MKPHDAQWGFSHLEISSWSHLQEPYCRHQVRRSYAGGIIPPYSSLTHILILVVFIIHKANFYGFTEVQFLSLIGYLVLLEYVGLVFRWRKKQTPSRLDHIFTNEEFLIPLSKSDPVVVVLNFIGKTFRNQVTTHILGMKP